MWTIQRMDEMDDGDEERLPGEPMMTAVTLESDLGEIHSISNASQLVAYAGITRRRRVA